MAAYAGLYSGVEQYASGRPAAGVAVTVYQHGTTTPATLYTDRTKTVQASNPVTTDASGNLVFYAAPGLYDVTAASGGTVTVAVPVDPADLAAAATGTTQGLVKLAGDLAGTADAPTVPGLTSKLSTAYSGPSTLAAPLVTVTFSDVPATADTDLYQVYQTYNGVAYATRRDNERGNIRLQTRPGSYFDHLFLGISDPLNDSGAGGDPFRTEALDSGGLRYGTGGIDRNGRLKVSLSGFVAPVSYGANYSQASTDGYGNAIGTVGVRMVADDRVELRGGLVVGASASVNSEVMLTLPAASWYPAQSRGLNLGASSGTAVPALVRANGTITIQRASVTTGTVIWLDGQTYKL